MENVVSQEERRRRRALALAIKNGRRNENISRSNPDHVWKIDRSENHYFAFFGNLIPQLLRNAESVGGYDFYDFGSGITSGMFGMKKLFKRSFPEINFKATTLSYDKRIEQYLGSQDTKIVSLENLRGIPDGAVGAFIALMSFQFIADNTKAAEELHRVMAPGATGIFAFPNGNSPWFLKLKASLALARKLNHDPSQLILELEKKGFKITKIAEDFRVPQTALSDVYMVTKL